MSMLLTNLNYPKSRYCRNTLLFPITTKATPLEVWNAVERNQMGLPLTNSKMSIN